MTAPTTRAPRPPSRATTARGAGLTHPGCLREANEDAILADASGALYAVADGMGGHAHGALAAEIVIRHLARLPHGATAEAAARALIEANDAVCERARAEGLAMGATAVAALVEAGRAVLIWAGDSRGYRLRRGRLLAVTRDHSLVQELVDRGRLSAEQARNHPQGHVVTRAVGAAERLDLDRAETDLEPGDRLLLCSDGLTGCVREAEIGAILDAAPEPVDACRELVRAALERGAPDNVSAVVIAVDAAEAT